MDALKVLTENGVSLDTLRIYSDNTKILFPYFFSIWNGTKCSPSISLSHMHTQWEQFV